ncbi:MAG: TIGR02594 family protein [Thiobacillus sp.]|nr:TIGR02594 family protein [Thiobacillus sp.]
MNEPAWLIEARKHIGTKEIPGAKHEPKILGWWKAIKRGGIKTDEVPWCAAFVGGCLEAVGIISSRFESAKSYMTWGLPLKYPVPGCIAVFSRAGGGHVGFVVAGDGNGRLLILGGNQNNQVSIAPFDETRVIGYRWPRAVPIVNSTLSIIGSTRRSSTNEA